MKAKVLFIAAILFAVNLKAQLKGPESITFCPDNGKYYVSSAKSGEIYSFETKNGKAAGFEKIVEGLNFPRGMYALDSKIYVTEAPEKEIIAIDTKNGKTTNSFELPLSYDLNDLTIYKGKIYVSDLRGNTIWQVNIKTKKVEVFAKTQSPNGLFIQNNLLTVVSFDNNGTIKQYDLKTKKLIKTINTGLPHLDGLALKQGKFIVSYWGKDYKNGGVAIIDKNGKTKKTVTGIAGPADFYVQDNIILIPLMSENKIVIKKL